MLSWLSAPVCPQIIASLGASGSEADLIQRVPWNLVLAEF